MAHRHPPVFLVDTGATVEHEGSAVALRQGVRGFQDRAAARICLARPWDGDEPGW